MEPVNRKRLFIALAIVGCLAVWAVSAWLLYNSVQVGASFPTVLLCVLLMILSFALPLLMYRTLADRGFFGDAPPAIIPRRHILLPWIFGLGGCAAIVLVIWVSWGAGPGVIIVWSIGFGVSALLISAQIARYTNRARRQAVLEYLDQAARLDLPLHEIIAAAAQSEQGRLARRLYNLAGELELGQSLGAALMAAVPEASADAGALEAAERIGQLPRTLARQLRRADLRAKKVGGEVFLFEYPLIYLTIIALVASFVVMAVAPKFFSIFQDFHQPTPWTLEFVVHVLPLILSVLLGIVAGAAILWWVSRPMMPWISAGVLGENISRFLGGIVERIPLIGAMVRDRALADLCDFLTDALAAAVPLDAALIEAAYAQRNPVLRQRIAAWAAGLARGEPLPSAARAAGMPALLVGMLPVSTDGESLASVTAFLARSYESRWLSTQAIIQSFYIPLVVFTMGSGVAIIAIAIFKSIGALQNASMHFPMGF